ncbi:MAG TPA: hypothetical protein VJB13_04385 [Candidatus Nanoarchaeia archaeon]|nr:hypothetical protein [Candidatus Nanoarchaeia archaeon]
MLDQLITEYIVWRNLRKIAPEGSLSSLFPNDKPSLMTLRTEEGIGLGYYIRFLCTNQGIILYNHSHKKFSEGLDRYHEGIFVVALDPNLAKRAKNGRVNESTREERITNVVYNSPEVPEKAKRRIENTAAAFNEYFGFSYNYLFIEGFTYDEDFHAQ